MLGVIAQSGTITVADDLEVRAPGHGEVSVRVLASGICRSDLLALEHPNPDPVVLGHEAAGVVCEVGPGVSAVSVGQLVAVSCQRPCQRCEQCARGRYSACPSSFGSGETPFTWRGSPVRSTARVSSLAEQITVDAMQVFPVTSLEPAAAALMGCAVSTGYGNVRHVAKVVVGECVAVIGVGGIGVNAIQAARLVGAKQIVAVDVNPNKAKVAHEFGADAFVRTSPGLSGEELGAQLSEDIGFPIDAVIECTGQATVIAAALSLLGRGGRLALVGLPHGISTARFSIMDMMSKQLTIAGAWNGACNPFLDIPDIVQLAEQGRLNLSGQISHRWPLAEAAEALSAPQDGDVVRVVVDVSTDVP